MPANLKEWKAGGKGVWEEMGLSGHYLVLGVHVRASRQPGLPVGSLFWKLPECMLIISWRLSERATIWMRQ